MKKVKVIFPDGSTAELDESQVEGAISAGAKRYSEQNNAKSTSMVFPDGSIADIPENHVEGAIKSGAIKKKESNGTTVDSNTIAVKPAPTTLPLKESTVSGTSIFDNPNLDRLNIAKPNLVKGQSILTTADGGTFPILNPTPLGNATEDLQELQHRILTKTITPQDVQVLSTASGKSVDATNAYLTEGATKGASVENVEQVAKTKNKLTDYIDRYNQNYGTQFDAQDVLSSSDKLNNFLSIAKEATLKNAKGTDLSKPIDKAGLQRLGFEFGTTPVTNEMVNQVVGMTVEEDRKNGVSKDETLNKISKRLNPIEFARVQKANNESISTLNPMAALGNLVDNISGGDKRDQELLNYQKGIAELKYNESLQQNSINKISQGVLDGNPDLVDEGKSDLAQVDNNVVDRYPSIQKQEMVRRVNETIARETGVVEGSETESGSRVERALGSGITDYARVLSDLGYLDNPKTKDVALSLLANPSLFANNSILGGAVSSFIQPFKDLGMSVGDITGFRNNKNILADKIKDELFPKELPNLKTDVRIARNVVNTTANLAGMLAIASVTEGAGIQAGLTRSISQKLGAYTSFGLPSFDASLKDSKNFIDSEPAQYLYASINAIANAEGGRVLDLGKITRIPGVSDDFAKLAKKISENDITEKGARELLEIAQPKYIDFAVKYGKNVTKGAATMAYFTTSNNIIRMAFGDPNTTTESTIEQAGHAFLDGVVGMSIMGGFGAAADMRKEKNTTYKGTIYNMALNHDAAKDVFDLGLKNGEYDKDAYDGKIKILNTAKAAKDFMDIAESETGTPLTQEQKAVFVANQTAEKFLRNKAENAVLEVNKKKYNEQADKLQEQSNMVLDGLKFTSTLEPLINLYEAEKQYNIAKENFNPTNKESDDALQSAKDNYDKLYSDYLNDKPDANQKAKVEIPIATEESGTTSEKTAPLVSEKSISEIKGTLNKSFFANAKDEQSLNDALDYVSGQWHDKGTRSQIERDFPKEIVDLAKEKFPQQSQESLSIPTVNKEGNSAVNFKSVESLDFTEVRGESSYGSISGERVGDKFNMETVNVNKNDRGRGYGKQLYKSLIDKLFNEGVIEVNSDRTVSESAGEVWKSLAKEGYNVIESPNIKLGRGKKVGGGETDLFYSIEGGNKNERPFKINKEGNSVVEDKNVSGSVVDVKNVYYHGTDNVDVKKDGDELGFFSTPTFDYANRYAKEIRNNGDVYVIKETPKNTFSTENDVHIKNILEKFKAESDKLDNDYLDGHSNENPHGVVRALKNLDKAVSEKKGVDSALRNYSLEFEKFNGRKPTSKHLRETLIQEGFDTYSTNEIGLDKEDTQPILVWLKGKPKVEKMNLSFSNNERLAAEWEKNNPLYGFNETTGKLQIRRNKNPYRRKLNKEAIPIEVKDNTVQPTSQQTVNSVVDKGFIDFTAKGGNKVVNENGEPLVVHHGTTDKGFGSYKYTYYTADHDYAKQYAEGKGRVVDAHIDIKNPFRIDAKYMGQGEIVLDNKIIGFYRDLQPDAVEKLKAAGYDGIIADYPEKDKKNFEVIPFDKSQIKEIEKENKVLDKGSISNESQRENIMNMLVDMKSSDFDYRITSEISQKDREKGIADLRNGKDTAAARKVKDLVDNIIKEGVLPVHRGSGGMTEKYDVPFEYWFGLEPNERKSAEKLDDNAVSIINEEGITKDNIDNLKHLFNEGGFPYTEQDFQQVKDYLSRQDEGNAKPENISSESKGIQEVNPKDLGTDIPPPEPPIGKYAAKAKEIADKIREGKINKLGGFKSSTGFDAVWDASLEVVAKTIEAGGKITDAIDAGLKHIKESEWYKNLTDKKDFEDKYREHLNNEFDEGRGIKHASTAALREKYNLGAYERNNATDAELETLSVEAIKEGYNPETLIKQMEEGIPPTGVENFILKKYLATLEAKFDKNPTDENLEPIERLVKATDKIGSLQSEAFRTRKGLVPVDDSLAGYFITEKELNLDASLTDKQKDTVRKEYADITEAQKKYDEKLVELEAENTRLKAATEVKKVVAKKSITTKRTHEDFVKERRDILDSIKEKLKKARSETNVTPIPYAKELVTIAPDVAKLVKNLVEEGVTKLSDIVADIHDSLKDSIKGLTTNDIHNIIAGDYNENKQPKNEVTKKVFELRQEAQLINKYEKLKNGIEPISENGKIKRNQELEALRKQIKEHDLTKLAEYTSKTKARIEKLEEDLRTENFLKPELPPKPLVFDKEALDAKDKLIKLKNERHFRILMHQHKNLSTNEKIMTGITEVLNVPRTLMTIVDYSAMLRQGLIQTISHPTFVFGGIKNVDGKLQFEGAAYKMLKAGASQKVYDRWFYDLKETPRYELMERSKLGITDSTNPLLSAREEAFMSNIAESIPIIGKTLKIGNVKIPGTNLVKGSERAYSMFLNKLRVDVFNRFADAMEERGLTYENSPKAFDQMAEYVNNSTGRGSLGKTLNKIAPLLNSLFFSPRLIASRLNMLTYLAQPRFYKIVPREVRIAYFKDMAKFIGVGMTVIALASLGGDDDETTVETDPRSSDFGKIKNKNTRWDIWGGFQQYIRVVSQTVMGERKKANGKISKIDGEGAFGEDKGDVLLKFGRGKLAPVPSMALDLFLRRTQIGEKIIFDTGKEKNKQITIDRYLKDHLLPLTYTGLEDAMKDQGVKALFTVGVPSVFGVGTQTYDTKKLKNK